MGLGPTPEEPCDLVADKGYHSRDVLKGLDDGPWKTRIAEPRPSQGTHGGMMQRDNLDDEPATSG